MSPKISVIIPTYNGDRYIAQAITSVLQQAHDNYEIIVVDDGSTDHTLAMLQPYKDRIRCFQQENKGVASARNYGISVAEGELIAFLDQDDLFLPFKLAKQAALFEVQPNLGLVNSGWSTISRAGKWLANVEPWSQLPELDASAWIIWKPIFPGALMIRRSWLEQAGSFDVRYQQTSDVDLALRLTLLECPSTWLQQITVSYRLHDKNTSRNVAQQVEELETVLNNFFERSDLPANIQKLDRDSRYQSWVWSAWRLYCQEEFTQMAECLAKSWQNRATTWTQTVMNWVYLFSLYTLERGEQLDVMKLTQLPQWQELIEQGISGKIIRN